MKVISIKRKSIIKLATVCAFALCICIFTTTFGMQHYYKLDFVTGLTTSNLNLRSGPGTRL